MSKILDALKNAGFIFWFFVVMTLVFVIGFIVAACTTPMATWLIWFGSIFILAFIVLVGWIFGVYDVIREIFKK